jgi:hypothetical protein
MGGKRVNAVKIALVMFPLIEVGGINSYVWVLFNAWKRMGHDVTIYHTSNSGAMRKIDSVKPQLVGRYVRLPGEQLAIGSPEGIKTSRKILNECDLVVFGHQCPHLNMKGKGDDRWKGLYDLKVPVMNIWHDTLWKDNYPWLKDVARFVKVNLLANMNTWKLVAKDYPGYFVHAPIPVDTTKAGLYLQRKENKVVWLPQWKDWKGIWEFVYSTEFAEFPTEIYNSGIEYHYMRRQPDWGTIIGHDVFRPKGKNLRGNDLVTVMGPRVNTEVPKILMGANVSVDLSGYNTPRYKGQTTCVHFESMVYGAVLACHESIIKDGPIPENCAWPISNMSPIKIAHSINEIMRHPAKQAEIARHALEWIKYYAGDERIARGILKLVDRKTPHMTQRSKAVLGKLP